MVPVSRPVLAMPVEVMDSVASMKTEVTWDKAKDTNGLTASMDVDKGSVDKVKTTIGLVAPMEVDQAKASIGPVALMDMKATVGKASMDVDHADKARDTTGPVASIDVEATGGQVRPKTGTMDDHSILSVLN